MGIAAAVALQHQTPAQIDAELDRLGRRRAVLMARVSALRTSARGLRSGLHPNRPRVDLLETQAEAYAPQIRELTEQMQPYFDEYDRRGGLKPRPWNARSLKASTTTTACSCPVNVKSALRLLLSAGSRRRNWRVLRSGASSRVRGPWLSSCWWIRKRSGRPRDMGPYCRYCDHRCFVYDPLRSGWLLATCERGKRHDRESAGYDIDSAREQVAAREAEAARADAVAVVEYGYVVTVHRPGLPALNLGFGSASAAQQACQSLTADLTNTAHLPGTTVSWSERPDEVFPLAPVPVEPVELAPMIAIEAKARRDGCLFPDLYNRLTAQTGHEAAGRIWGDACAWLDDDWSDRVAQ